MKVITEYYKKVVAAASIQSKVNSIPSIKKLIKNKKKLQFEPSS